jgi:hypothetical protein
VEVRPWVERPRRWWELGLGVELELELAQALEAFGEHGLEWTRQLQGEKR